MSLRHPRRTKMPSLESAALTAVRNAVIDLMHASGVTQAQVAQRMGVSQAGMSSRFRRHFTLRHAEEILGYLGCEIEFRIVRKTSRREES